jgi:calcyclin binding protein
MSEIEEVRKLIAQATFPGVVNVLKQYEQQLQVQKEKEEVANTQMEVDEDSPVVEDLPPPKKPEPSVQLKQDVRVAAPLAIAGRITYTPITDFAWDQDGYDSPTVTVYVDLEGVGAVKDSVSCKFTKSSFDLEVLGLRGRNYRLLKDNLDKDVVPDKCRYIVKKNKVVVKLQKVKGSYSYESWTNLTSKKTAEKRNQAQKDPSAGIMDMMKDMYDEGDDNMKKIIGEAMLKSKSGEKMDTAMPPMPGGL